MKYNRPTTAIKFESLPNGSVFYDQKTGAILRKVRCVYCETIGGYEVVTIKNINKIVYIDEKIFSRKLKARRSIENYLNK